MCARWMYTTAQNVWKMTKIMNRNNIVVVIVGACQVDDPADFGGRLDRSTETQNDDGKQRWKWIFFLTRRAASLSVLLTFVITIYHFPFYVSMVFFSLSLCYGRVHLISFRPVLIVLPPALSVSDDKLWLYNCKRVWGAGWRDGTMTKFYVLFFRTQTEIPLFCQQFLMRKMSKDSSRMLDSLSLICIRVGTEKVGRTTTKNKRATNWKKKSYNFFFCLVQVQFQFFRSRKEKSFSTSTTTNFKWSRNHWIFCKKVLRHEREGKENLNFKEEDEVKRAKRVCQCRTLSNAALLCGWAQSNWTRRVFWVRKLDMRIIISVLWISNSYIIVIQSLILAKKPQQLRWDISAS